MTRSPRDGSQPEQERRYEHQIPSRDEISRLMEQAGRPLTLEALGSRFEIHTDQHRRALEARLRAMVRDGQLLFNRAREYCLTRHLDLVAGTVHAHRDGFGFLTPDEGGDDVYLSAREMRSLWDGDRVAVRTSESPRGREGHLVEILARGKTTIVGRFRRERGIDWVLEDGDERTDVLIARGQSLHAKPGDIVRVEVLEYPKKDTHAVGRVVEVVGRSDDPGIETEVAMLAHGIPHDWPDSTLAEARALPSEVQESSKRGREDVRGLPLVTIDGADAKDFDDAVFAEPAAHGWRLLVAIADVSHYVQPDTPLDREARLRGTSVYFPDRVIPMLPEELSNGLCSLNPHVDRLCFVCEMTVTARGEVTRSRFFDGVMRSHARLTYEEAAQILAAARPHGKQAELKPALAHLNAVYGALRGARERRGAIDFDLAETKIQLDERGKVKSVRAVERLVTHKIIEECMIAANVESAKQMKRARIPGLYRVHEGPEEERLEELQLFLRTFGFKLHSAQKIAPKELNQIIEKVAGKPEAELIETVILRSLKQARYQPNNVGHFGLALAEYAHFTSPIRRYPDLLVHRAIRWLNQKRGVKGFRYALGEMEQLGEHTSRTERRADDATRDVAEQLKCIYLKDHVGATFDVIVASVVPFGLFVRVPELHVDGLVHVTSLPRDYYHRDPTGTELRGERSGNKYRLTDKLRVRLAAVNVDERKIDFVPVDDDAAGDGGASSADRGARPRKKGGARRGSGDADPGAHGRGSRGRGTRGRG
ncbi:MAG TPA: ribonuclease R [Gammaproteobacteria bacterium]|jgi:ribonuclease R|nr:ribonuclease R [Gammaproteobacteria bacterium]